MLKKVLIGVAAVLAVLGRVVATRPSAFHIERSIAVAAPADSVFRPVNDFPAWSAWSPWEKLDPQMKRAFDGAPSGVGAIYSWVGNDKTGEGRMTIERSDRPSAIAIKLEFIKPFAATNQATFTFAPAAPPGTDETKVTWAMDGENNFGMKAASLFMNMDKLVGGDFERGLTALKTVAESAPKGSPEDAKAIK